MIYLHAHPRSKPVECLLCQRICSNKRKIADDISGEGNSKEKSFIDVWARSEDGSFTFLYFWLRHVHLPAQFIDPQKQTKRQSAKLFQSIVRKIYSPFPVWVIGGVSWKSLYLSDDKGGFGDILRDFRCLSRCFYLLLGEFSSRLAELLLFTLDSSNFLFFIAKIQK